MATLWTSLGIIVISLIITIAINMKATMLQTRAGYRACANKRIEIAEHLRYLPMGCLLYTSYRQSLISPTLAGGSYAIPCNKSEKLIRTVHPSVSYGRWLETAN